MCDATSVWHLKSPITLGNRESQRESKSGGVGGGKFEVVEWKVEGVMVKQEKVQKSCNCDVSHSFGMDIRNREKSEKKKHN